MKRRCSHIKYLNGTPFTNGNGNPCDLCGKIIQGAHMNFYVGSFQFKGQVADMIWAQICQECISALQNTIRDLTNKTKAVATLTKGKLNDEIPF
jgi:hypothetical protein